MTPELPNPQRINSIPVPAVRPQTANQWMDWMTSMQMRAFVSEASRGVAIIAKHRDPFAALTYATLLVNTVCRCSEKLYMTEFGEELLGREVQFVTALFEGACKRMDKDPSTAIFDENIWKDFLFAILVAWGGAATLVKLKENIPIGVQLPGARPFL